MLTMPQHRTSSYDKSFTLSTTNLYNVTPKEYKILAYTNCKNKVNEYFLGQGVERE